MFRYIIGLSLLCSTTLSAVTYYALDNKSTASSDEIFNDPFLALRTKTTGQDTLYSYENAMENLENFECPEWNQKPSCEVIDNVIDQNVCVTNERVVFDYTTPCFNILTLLKNPEKIHWQISTDLDFTEISANLNQIEQYTSSIQLSLINQTFLNPRETYFFRAKIFEGHNWSGWSEPFSFQVLKPDQPKNISCARVENKCEISWEKDPTPGIRYLVFGDEGSAFLPSLYSECFFNLIGETEENSLLINDSNLCYFRVIAVKGDCYSVPSPLAVAHDFHSLLEELNPSFKEPVLGYTYNPNVPRELWNELKPYFLPSSNPAKKQLDKIFQQKTRVLKDFHSLKAAGFRHPVARQWTRLVVTSHKKVPGYIIKLYTDYQHPHRGRPEWFFWVSRIKGVALIQEQIDQNNLNHLFKTPKKWIYPIPHESARKTLPYRKDFILVEEDMDILSDAENEARWKSGHVTADKLNVLFKILQGLGLWDCAKPANIPFSRDGKIAFIDTQTFHTWPVKLNRLTPFLAPEMQTLWDELIQTTKKK